MKLNDNDRYLTLLKNTLVNVIQPQLEQESALATVGMMTKVLDELIKREHGSRELLLEQLASGRLLQNKIERKLNVENKSINVIEEINQHTALSIITETYANLSARLDFLCSELAQEETQDHLSLLQEIAQWEYDFYHKQAELPVPKLPTAEPSGKPLTRESLERYLNTLPRYADIDTRVDTFEPLTGGFGKQTYFAKLANDSNSDANLVIRKTDPTPIMQHGACNLASEFTLLKALATVNYPAPRPLNFCAQFDDIDGSFYTMARIPGAPPGAFLTGIADQVDESLFMQLAEHLGKLHSLPLELFREHIAQHDDPRILKASVEDCYHYNLQGWERYLRDQGHLPSPYIHWLLSWLRTHIPADNRRPMLVHGDFNIHNILVHNGQVTAILDWECAGYGFPEQDLAYIRPHISQHIDWDRFVNHYRAHGGHELREEFMNFGFVYSALRTNLAGNRATENLQSGDNQDIRYSMVELGFTKSFMGMALDCAS